MQTRFSLALMAGLLLAGGPMIHAAEAQPTTKPSTQAATIEVSDAAAIKAAEGSTAVVTGTISKAAWSKSGKVMRISFKGAEDSKFEAVVFSKNKDSLDKKFSGDAATTLSGAKVKVTGKVSTYSPPNNADDKRPQTVIDNVKQIELADEEKK